MFSISTLLSLGSGIFSFFKSPKGLALLVLLLICGSAWGYHGYKVGKLNSLYSSLESEHTELKGKYGELELVIEKARHINTENLETIKILRAEKEVSDTISRGLDAKNKQLEKDYKRIVDSVKNKKDAPVSEKLVSILNQVNGVSK